MEHLERMEDCAQLRPYEIHVCVRFHEVRYVSAHSCGVYQYGLAVAFGIDIAILRTAEMAAQIGRIYRKRPGG